MSDAASGANAAFQAAAEVAREVATTATLELQGAREEVRAAGREVRAERAQQSFAVPELVRAVRTVRETVERTSNHAAAVADQRARALSQALHWLAEAQLAQVDVFEAGLGAPPPHEPPRDFRRRK